MAKESLPFDAYATGLVDLQALASTKVANGRFSLTTMLGRGGMGIVWLARDERLQSEVALKFLPPQIRFDPVALDDLRQETARSQKLTHPHIVRIHDLYECEGEDAFISMEYVNGSNLGYLRIQQAERVLTWPFVEPLVLQLCEALRYAHGEGVIHRDLKPANLMVEQTGRLKLADFGIARAVTDTMSRSSTAHTSGTLVYMSPQQLDGRSPNPTDDIYALGATLYELLTGKPPFFTGDLLHQVRHTPPRPLRERLAEFKLVNEVPAHVEDLVLACLNKGEAQRPQNAQEVIQWLSSGGRPAKNQATSRWTSAWTKPIHAMKTRPAAYLAAATLLAAAAWALTHPTRAKVAARDRNLGYVAQTNMSDPKAGHAPARETATQPLAAFSSQIPTPASAAASEKTPPGTSSITAVPSSSGAKPLTALQLAHQGNTHVSERCKNKIARILAGRTPVNLPPQSWQIRYYDPQARHKLVEVRFEGGEMVRVHEPARLLEFFGGSAPKPMDLAQLKIDSDEALQIALALSPVRDCIVRSVEFELERGYGGSPVWKVRLFGAMASAPAEDTDLGYAIILADDGKVLKETLSRKQQRGK